MGKLAAGSLDQRISLTAAPSPVPDGAGGWLPPVAAAPLLKSAAVRVLSGTEALRLGQPVGTTVAEFTVRYSPAVTVQTQVHWNDKTLGVRQVVHDTRKEYTTLTCVDNGRG